MRVISLFQNILWLSDDGEEGSASQLGRRGQMNGYSPVRPRSSNRISTPRIPLHLAIPSLLS